MWGGVGVVEEEEVVVEEVSEEVGRKCWTLHQPGSVYIPESVGSYFNIPVSSRNDVESCSISDRIWGSTTVLGRKSLFWKIHTA